MRNILIISSAARDNPVEAHRARDNSLTKELFARRRSLLFQTSSFLPCRFGCGFVVAVAPRACSRFSHRFDITVMIKGRERFCDRITITATDLGVEQQ